MVNNDLLVSIIIPVYNAEKYINRCVDSLLKQTYSNFEIILVDDGSKDDSANICDFLAKKDKRIAVYHKENGGSGSARNFGLKKAIGDYILFIDSDDYIEVNTIEKLIESIEVGYDIICVGFDRVDEETKKVYSREMISMPFDELEISDQTICETAFISPACWGKLFSKKLLDDISFSNNTIEDILFFTELMPKVKKIKFIKEVLWHYMVNSNSLIMTIKESSVDNFESDLLVLKNKYISNNYSSIFMNYLTLQAVIHECISLPSRLYNNKDCNINKRIKHVKKYMNDNFSNWKKVKIKIKGRKIKKLAIYTIILMYRIGIFKLFLSTYNFCINKLKIDVKW